MQPAIAKSPLAFREGEAPAEPRVRLALVTRLYREIVQCHLGGHQPEA